MDRSISERRTEDLEGIGTTSADGSVSAPWWGRVVQGLAVAAALLLTAGVLFGQEKEEVKVTVEESEVEEPCVCVSPDSRTIVVSRLPHLQSFRFLGQRGRLGVFLDGTQGEEFDAVGARVTSVVSGGPADDAGIQDGDIILSVGGKSVLQPLDDQAAEEDLESGESVPVQRLIHLARGLKSGEEVEIRYRRGDQEGTATLTVGEAMGAFDFGTMAEPFIWRGEPGDWSVRWRQELDEEERARLEERLEEARERMKEMQELGQEEAFRQQAEAMKKAEEAMARAGRTMEQLHFRFDEPDRLRIVVPKVMPFEGGVTVRISRGLSLVPMNAELGEYFGTDHGVLVSEVDEDSELGLRAGDVILEIDGRAVTNSSQAHRILRSYDEGEELEFRIMRQKREQTVQGTMS